MSIICENSDIFNNFLCVIGLSIRMKKLYSKACPNCVEGLVFRNQFAYTFNNRVFCEIRNMEKFSIFFIFLLTTSTDVVKSATDVERSVL